MEGGYNITPAHAQGGTPKMEEGVSREEAIRAEDENMDILQEGVGR